MTTETKVKKAKKLPKLPRLRTPKSESVPADLQPTAADAEALRNVHNMFAAKDPGYSIADRLRRGLGIKPQPVAASVVDHEMFAKTAIEGLLGGDASLLINAAFAEDPALLPLRHQFRLGRPLRPLHNEDSQLDRKMQTKKLNSSCCHWYLSQRLQRFRSYLKLKLGIPQMHRPQPWR